MSFHDFILPVLAFFSEVIGTVSGFGSSTFFIPIAIYFEKFELVLALTAFLHCFSNIFKLVLFRNSLSFDLIKKMALPYLILTFVGSLMAVYFSAEVWSRLLGFFLVVLSIVFIWKSRFQNKKWPAPVIYSVIGFSGFFTGLIGTGGALRGLALAFLNLEKSTFVAVSAAIDFGGDFVRLLVYLRNQFMDWSQWYYLPLLLFAGYLGPRVGQMILLRIHQQQFEKIVAGFVFLNGLLLIFRA